ncbi:MAG TPA: hypothetical protein VFG59_19580 [Anaeromyxobacter sp.]|nr:hypothetical protein [Anaeromyxobacter sp.]
MRNLLLEPVEYRTEQTAFGTWRSFMFPTGAVYQEFTSHRTVMGMPFLHYTAGVCPETGRRRVARGFIAVGRRAVGVIAVGQMAVGAVAIGQAGIGLLLGLGQLTCGLLAVGQAALGFGMGIGQLATGWVAVGQLALGHWVLAQIGLGAHAWLPRHADPAAVEFFRSLLS